MTKLPEQLPAIAEVADLWQRSLHWQPTATECEKFTQLYQQVLAANQQFNLTRIITPWDFWEKHLWDSLSGIAPWLAGRSSPPWRVLDIGTGAGFPGLPVAIVQPTWQVTLLDSIRKKMAFLAELISVLALQNAGVIVDRAEALGQAPQHRENYDLVLVRAVGSAAVCAEYALPLLRLGGFAVLYRGHWTDIEMEDLTEVIPHLGGELSSVTRFKTPVTQSDRCCLTLTKTQPTPLQFPRPVGTPTQKPLRAQMFW